MAAYNFDKRLVISLKDIYYDVRNNAFVTGNSRSTGDNHEIVAGIQASDDDEDANKILRAMQNAMGDLIADLAEYEPMWCSMTSAGKSSETDLFNDEATGDESKDLFTFATIKSTYSSVIIEFENLPTNFNIYVAPAIAQNIHRYIYNKAMGDWFLATNKDDAQDYFALTEVNVQNIREAINKRIIPSR